ncbi:4-oxalocrotonate tautomerase family protein [Tamlana fucoidanivorans]|uniref:Tautomerase n=1 Tax=Allotamlana fucoidanivorans TaxID=2583814 RepID=A0A5C4SLT7_9FLAO|nr:4-oxalocrotonate tautomerase family protein [Tamlana fucoidanivorans]TNJ44252.1 4-oxalocrotonate tautomerase family protein [Tamlana fucoidanivorans]
MPYINIKVTDEQVTPEQKRQLIAGATQLMVNILNKNPQTTHVVIDEVPASNWGVNGQQYSGTKNQVK